MENSHSNSPRYRGIIPPVVTPLSGRDELDRVGTQRLIEHLLQGGVHGLFILGSTGEAPSLSYRLRREFIDLVCELVAGRSPVLVGITDTAFVESVALAEHAARAGAEAVVLSTPYYFPAGQTELLAYVRNLVAELPLPLMLYNMPSLTKVWFEIETLQQLCDLPGIVGLKDSSGDLLYYQRAVGLKQQRPDWSILLGPEALLVESLELGGDGGVSGGANLFPRLFVECFSAWQAGDRARTQELRQLIVSLQRIYDIGKYPSRYIKATKSGLSILGICSDIPAEPFHHFKEPERLRVQAILEEIQQTGRLPS